VFQALQGEGFLKIMTRPLTVAQSHALRAVRVAIHNYGQALGPAVGAKKTETKQTDDFRSRVTAKGIVQKDKGGHRMLLAVAKNTLAAKVGNGAPVAIRAMDHEACGRAARGLFNHQSVVRVILDIQDVDRTT
jgi:L-asparaginase/Glu-tRNA(Gln) amidotransferase subunit D